MNDIDDQLARQVALRAADEVLPQKRSHDFGYVLFDPDLGEEILAAKHSPSPHADQVNTSTARIDERGDHIDITVDLQLGRGRARMWTCDLTKEYVAINGDYRS